MYLSKLNIQNFRKLSNLELEFNEGLNLLVGENDSGKSAIIDAIKFVTGTHSNDWIKIEKDDFYTDGKTTASEIKITCWFKKLSKEEAAAFLEWLSIDDGEYYLKLTLTAKLKQKIDLSSEIYFDVKAGEDEESGIISGEAKNKLKVTYLKPLRDAEYELTPRRGSRLSQILSGYEIFQTKDAEEHPLVITMNSANEEVKDYFENKEGKQVSQIINDSYLKEFSLINNPLTSKFEISKNQLSKILEKLELLGLSKEQNSNLGLGSNNLLFIAAEMLLLKRESGYVGLRLTLIEEIEAHLHPQLQINLIDFINSQSKKIGFQSIITTHSNSIASAVEVSNLVICRNGKAFSLREEETKLNIGDYEFLRRFLDDTKSNLFFANGVIIVEGHAENLMLPTFAELIGYPLHKHGVSIVNVGNTALLRYSRIFHRKDGKSIGIKVACIADRDIPPKEAREHTYIVRNHTTKKDEQRSLISSTRKIEEDYSENEIKEKVEKVKKELGSADVSVFITTTWTLEFELARSCLREIVHQAIQLALQSDNLEKPIDLTLMRKISKQYRADFKKWNEDKKSLNRVAVEIYEPLARNQASKAAVAQIMSFLLKKYKKKIDLNQLLNDPYLKYLVEAIKHAANV